MAVNLIRKRNEWIVVHAIEGEVVNDRFPNIESAAELLNKLGLNDDEIDAALCDLFALEHQRAIFDSSGQFARTEEL